MNILKKYSEYLKDNPEGYWFKRKVYGWGWTPVKWQGWVVLLVYILILFCILNSIDFVQNSKTDTLINFAPKFIILTSILIFICYKKGEKPKWMWGFPEKK